MGVTIVTLDGSHQVWRTKTSPLTFRPHPMFVEFSEHLPPEDIRKLKRDAGPVMHEKLHAPHAKTRARIRRAGPGITTLTGLSLDLLLAIPRLLLARKR